jgi:hypothetical protein
LFGVPAALLFVGMPAPLGGALVLAAVAPGGALAPAAVLLELPAAGAFCALPLFRVAAAFAPCPPWLEVDTVGLCTGALPAGVGPAFVEAAFVAPWFADAGFAGPGLAEV